MDSCALQAPLIVRVAGLPAAAMVSFSHPALVEAIARRERLRGELDALRASLVEGLHRAIGGANRQERRFLLEVKRRCFNGEDLLPRRSDPRWPLLTRLASSLVDEVVAREEAIVNLDAAIEQSYHRAVQQERESVVQLFANPALRRGIALASQTVAQHLDSLNEREVSAYGRREKRLCMTLLRYASRAALKTSPFVTLTRIALGRARDDSPGFSFLGWPWREVSAVGLDRELLGSYLCLLLRCPSFVEGLPIALNETLSNEDGAYRFFRPGRWVFEEAEGTFRREEPAFVRLQLEGPLVSWLLTELRRGPKKKRHLLAEMQAALGEESPDLLAETMAQLLSAGFLIPVFPWDFSAPDLEQRILELLDGPAATELRSFREGLRELNRFVHGYAEAATPAAYLADAKLRMVELFQALAAPAGVRRPIEVNLPDSPFEEDVLLLPREDSQSLGEIVRFPADRVRELLHDLAPLVRLATLHSGQHELLHTLAAFASRHWPGASDVGFLDFFAATQPLFAAYIRHQRTAAELAPVFNPLELAAVEDLVAWRKRVDREMTVSFDTAGRVQRLCPHALASLLDQVPAAYAGPREFCAFVQPLDDKARTWVVNSLREGYGRFGARFTAAMERDMRERWTGFFLPLSRFEIEGEPVELIDMPGSGGRTLDVHVSQTGRVLQMPGDGSSLPADRVLGLRDLRVRLRGSDRFPVLTDRSGRRLLPVQLGSSASRSRPTLLKFLAAFGCGEVPPMRPMGPPRSQEGVRMIDRHQIGSAVYVRRRWLAEVQSLLLSIDGQSEAKIFVLVNAWRLARGIPDRVFVVEWVGMRRKPQFVDFSSPSFVQVFRSILSPGSQRLALEEALPEPDRIPPRKQAWAAEVQLESFCLRPELRRSARARRED